MKQYSMIGCLLRHPLKVIGRTMLIWFAFVCILAGFNWDSEFSTNLSLFISFCLAMKRVQKKTNEELMMLHRMSPQQQSAYKKNKRKSSWIMRLFHFVNKPLTIFSVGGSFEKGMESAIYGWFKDDGSDYATYRAEQQREANERARNRWRAKDMQKKAQWDAKDLYKRGKDIGARQRANDARYWRNEAKKYY